MPSADDTKNVAEWNTLCRYGRTIHNFFLLELLALDTYWLLSYEYVTVSMQELGFTRMKIFVFSGSSHI